MSSQLWDDDSAEGSLWSRSFDFDDCDGDPDCSVKGKKNKTLSLLVEEVRLISFQSWETNAAARTLGFFLRLLLLILSSSFLVVYKQSGMERRNRRNVLGGRRASREIPEVSVRSDWVSEVSRESVSSFFFFLNLDLFSTLKKP